MEFLLVDEDGEGKQVVGRELTDDELKMIEDQELQAFRFRGNRFEVLDARDDGDKEEGPDWDLTWGECEVKK